MRIAWITTGFSKDEKDFGGAAAIHNLAKELSQRENIELIIFSFYYPLNQPEYSFYNAKIYSFAEKENISKFEKIKLWKRCRKKFEEEHVKRPFDIIHSVWSGESGYVASRLSRKLKIPFIANVCGGELAELPEIHYGSRTKFWQRTFVDIAFERADKIIVGSDYIIEKIDSHYGTDVSEKALKIPFGVDEMMFFPNKTKTNFPVLVTIGSAVPVKAYNIMFKAVKIASQKYPSIKLAIYGRDDKNMLSIMIDELGLDKNVEHKGFIDYEKIPDILNNGDIFILSSLYESQNMSLVEAAFCGLPVVSANVGIAGEITENIVEPGNTEALAEKITEVIENYKNESERALKKITVLSEKFSLVKSVENFIELYKSF
jgi:glycosyltransferase involved in cell wall biosynthesis